jgi:flagellar motor switch/type III secretory pathway protein FliN
MSSTGETSTPRAAGGAVRAAEIDERLAHLPAYTRSLLRVEVPVRVTLADTNLPLKRILELGQGSIIPFAKSCEEPLTLSVGNYDVAVGEAVKVGDKFGLRITSMVMPREKFFPLQQDSPESKVHSPQS